MVPYWPFLRELVLLTLTPTIDLELELDLDLDLGLDLGLDLDLDLDLYLNKLLDTEEMMILLKGGSINILFLSLVQFFSSYTF